MLLFQALLLLLPCSLPSMPSMPSSPHWGMGVSYALRPLLKQPRSRVYVMQLHATIPPDKNQYSEYTIDSIEEFAERAPREESFLNSLSTATFNRVTKFAETMVFPQQNETEVSLPISVALQKLKTDMEFLDDVAGRESQMTYLEFGLLFGTVAASAVAPSLFGFHVVEFLVPSMAAVAAAVGLSAEYNGKMSVAKGKEVAALATQAAAESEVVLAQAERVKAVLPLCVGLATIASLFALLTPNLAEELLDKFNIQLISETYLLMPLVSVLAAAVASLAQQEATGLSKSAVGVGNRRFASSQSIGRTWLSATEQVDASSDRTSLKWRSFAIGVIPAPLFAVLVPGDIGFKAIVCTAIAAAQAAYYLSTLEFYLSEAIDAVAMKARTAAIADTYANQGSRAGSILPFTSALAGLCAAATAAISEVLPLFGSIRTQTAIAVLFPSCAAMFAAAASVSKARCEVDARAASVVAASGLIGEGPGQPRDPNKTVLELIGLAFKSSYTNVVMKAKQTRYLLLKRPIMKRIQSYLIKVLRFIYDNTPKPDREM